MIKIQNNTPIREPLPAFLQGLSQVSLYDLSWTDPALGVQDLAWWPEQSQHTPYGPETQKLGAEILTMGDQVVYVTHEVIDLTPAEIEDILQERRAKHKKQAEAEQDTVLNKISKNQLKKSLGLPPEISDADEVALKEYTKQIQADIDNPPETQAYNPPLPPGVTPPAVNSILITVTREPGWQGNIGWKAVISSGEDNFTPANLAIAEYTNPSCDGYLYTTGAFQQDGDTWYAVCPPGQGKGDVDINLGLLYGAAQLACFTFKAGNQEQKVYAYEEVI